MKLSPSDSVHGLVHQVGQGNLAALRPCVPGPGGHNQRIVEQHTLLRIIVSTTLGHTGDDQVDAAVVEFAIKNDSVGLRDVKYDAWILLQQRLEDRRQEIGRQRRRCPDAQLAKGGIGQKIDQARPYIVGSMPRLLRSTRCTPRVFSRSAIDFETADCVIARATAALPILPDWMTVVRILRSRSLRRRLMR
jgi:hypothetical protein